MYRAVKDVSREEKHGDLFERIEKGDLSYYGKDDLEAAYTIYKDVIRFDLKNQAITLELLQLARNPMSLVKQGIQMEEEAFQIGAPRNRNQQETLDEIVSKIHREIDGSDQREAFTAETTRQLAMYKALCNGPPDKIYQKIADNMMLEEEMKGYIVDGMTEKDLHLFKETLPKIKALPRCKTCHHKVKELYRAREPTVEEIEQDIHNHEDGMSESIFSAEDKGERFSVIPKAEKEADGGTAPKQV